MIQLLALKEMLTILLLVKIGPQNLTNLFIKIYINTYTFIGQVMYTYII